MCVCTWLFRKYSIPILNHWWRLTNLQFPVYLKTIYKIDMWPPHSRLSHAEFPQQTISVLNMLTSVFQHGWMTLISSQMNIIMISGTLFPMNSNDLHINVANGCYRCHLGVSISIYNCEAVVACWNYSSWLTNRGHHITNPNHAILKENPLVLPWICIVSSQKKMVIEWSLTKVIPQPFHKMS